jgi:hypothetical protein
MLAAVRTELLQFQTLRGGALVLGFTVVPVLALAALELNNLTWHYEFLIASNHINSEP